MRTGWGQGRWMVAAGIVSAMAMVGCKPAEEAPEPSIVEPVEEAGSPATSEPAPSPAPEPAPTFTEPIPPSEPESDETTDSDAGEQESPKPGGHTGRMDRGYRVAVPVPGKPGFAFNPFTNNLVDLRGLPPGTLVRDPADPDPDHKFRAP